MRHGKIGEKMIDPFNVLLNKISHGLSEKNLQSLIHICEIPDGYSERIQDGLALFKYLMRTNRISKDKIGYLRNLMRKILPKRCDLVNLVDDYIKKEYQTVDVSLVLEDFSQSLPEAMSPNPAVLSDGDGSNTSNELFNLINQYMYCCCRKLPSCFLIVLIILLVFAIILTSVFWYADRSNIDRKIKSNEALKNAGQYIIIAECFLLVLVIVGLLWKKGIYRHVGYVQFDNTTVQPNARIEANGKGKVSAPIAYRNKYGSSLDPEAENIGVSHVSIGFIVSPGETVVPHDV